MSTNISDVNSVDATTVEQVEFSIRTMATIAEGKTAAVAFREGVLRQFAVAGGDHEAVFIIGDRQVAIHLFHLFDAEAHFFNRTGIGHAFDGLRTFVMAHRHHAF